MNLGLNDVEKLVYAVSIALVAVFFGVSVYYEEFFYTFGYLWSALLLILLVCRVMILDDTLNSISSIDNTDTIDYAEYTETLAKKTKRIGELRVAVDSLERDNQELLKELGVKDEIIRKQTLMLAEKEN